MLSILALTFVPPGAFISTKTVLSMGGDFHDKYKTVVVYLDLH